MRKFVGVPALALVSVVVGAVVVAGQSPVSISWAYGFATAGPEPVAPPCPEDAMPHACSRPGRAWNDETPLSLPGSGMSFTVNHIQSHYDPADWYPDEHPPTPDIVQHGREEVRLRSCAHCHFHNGLGKPENGHLAGLPVQYFVEQIALFKSGGRKSADPRKANHNEMIQIARMMTDEETEAAAEYYASMSWQPWVKVVETETVPKTRVSAAGLFTPAEGGETEPLGQRIIEVPEFPDRTVRYRDPKAGFIAYVPVGSLAKGEALVTEGGGKTVACSVCHGADLRGMGNVPAIADRSASYTTRQLYNYQQGTRESLLMGPVVEELTPEDMIAISAYLASL